jgi:hypothetical protein
VPFANQSRVANTKFSSERQLSGEIDTCQHPVGELAAFLQLLVPTVLG